MYGLIVLRFRKPHRLFIEQHASVAETGRDPGVIFQGADAAVDVDSRIGLGVARIGDRDLLVAGAVSGEHISHRADELPPLCIAQAAQAALAFATRKGERALEIETSGGNGRELIALDRIAQPRLDTIPPRPAARQVTFERLWHGIIPQIVQRARSTSPFQGEVVRACLQWVDQSSRNSLVPLAE